MLLARQPILDRRRRVSGYELLLQPLNAPAPVTESEGGEGEGGNPIAEALDRCGLDTLTRGRLAFLKLPLTHLGPEVRQVFPPGRVVVEVPCDHENDLAIVDECHALRSAGYAVALDNFTLTPRSEPFMSLADYVKVDFLPSSSDHTKACVVAGQAARASMVAKRIEAMEVFNEAMREGFTHFQGYFFERPGLTRDRAVAPGQLMQLRLLHALSDTNLSVAQIEDLVKRDAALSYRILRMANSAAFAQRIEVTSIHHALLLVGRDTVRRWASLAVLAGLGSQSTDELVVMATVRARFCELLASRTLGETAAGEGFLIGLCSLLDVMLERPMTVVLDELPLPGPLRAALLGADNPMRRLIDCVVAYERGDWDSCLALATLAGIDARVLAPAYLDALHWAYELQKPTPNRH